MFLCGIYVLEADRKKKQRTDIEKILGNNIREQYKLAQKAATYTLARTSDVAQS